MLTDGTCRPARSRSLASGCCIETSGSGRRRVTVRPLARRRRSFRRACARQPQEWSPVRARSPQPHRRTFRLDGRCSSRARWWRWSPTMLTTAEVKIRPAGRFGRPVQFSCAWKRSHMPNHHLLPGDDVVVDGVRLHVVRYGPRPLADRHFLLHGLHVVLPVARRHAVGHDTSTLRPT